MEQWSRKDVYALLGRAEQGRLTPSDLENIDRLTDDDWTPLQVPTSEGKKRAVEALLEKKADVNKPRKVRAAASNSERLEAGQRWMQVWAARAQMNVSIGNRESLAR
eukprot:g57531.t1